MLRSSSLDDSVISSIQNYLMRENGIAAVYLFGSFVSGHFREGSDLDLAILFKRESIPDPITLLDLRERLSSISGILVDLACLNQASPILAMQVYRKGKKILDLSPREASEHYIRTMTEYADLKRVRKPIEQSILKGRIYD
jgi:predicted nucleotidyltransferase